MIIPITKNQFENELKNYSLTNASTLEYLSMYEPAISTISAEPINNGVRW